METNAQYHADATHYGSTQIRCYRDSPARFHGLYVAKTIAPEQPSNEMVLGSITHCLVAGAPFGQEFLVGDGCNSRRGKTWDDVVFEAERVGLTPILPAQLETAEAMAAAVRARPIASQLFGAEGPVEEPIRWMDRQTGIPLKCKPDKRLPGICVDLKSSSTPAPQLFCWLAWWKYAYHIQAALYLEGVATVQHDLLTDFVFVVVGNKPPHDVWCYKMSEAAIEAARADLDDVLRRLAHSLKADAWTAPGQLLLNKFDPPRGAAHADDVTLLIAGEEVSV